MVFRLFSQNFPIVISFCEFYSSFVPSWITSLGSLFLLITGFPSYLWLYTCQLIFKSLVFYLILTISSIEMSSSQVWEQGINICLKYNSS